jgi:hypothetical protein
VAKTIGFFTIELRQGVKAEEFIQFFNDQYAPLGARMGWKGSVLNAQRGETDGKLAVIWEILFDKQCDRYNTQHGQRILEPEFTELGKIWNKLVATAPLYDYIVKSE